MNNTTPPPIFKGSPTPPTTNISRRNPKIFDKKFSESYKSIFWLLLLILAQFIVFIICLTVVNAIPALFAIWGILVGLTWLQCYLFYQSTYFDVKNLKIKVWKYYFLLSFIPFANLAEFYFLFSIFNKLKMIENDTVKEYNAQMHSIEKNEELDKQHAEMEKK